MMKHTILILFLFSVFVVPRTIVQILHNRQGTFQQSDQQNISGPERHDMDCHRDGLNRYDGAKFITYKHDPENEYSLCHNYVRVLYEDSKGRLFVGPITVYSCTIRKPTASARERNGKTERLLTAISCPFWNVGTEKYGYRETTCVP